MPRTSVEIEYTKGNIPLFPPFSPLPSLIPPLSSPFQKSCVPRLTVTRIPLTKSLKSGSPSGSGTSILLTSLCMEGFGACMLIRLQARRLVSELEASSLGFFMVAVFGVGLGAWWCILFFSLLGKANGESIVSGWSWSWSRVFYVGRRVYMWIEVGVVYGRQEKRDEMRRGHL